MLILLEGQPLRDLDSQKFYIMLLIFGSELQDFKPSADKAGTHFPPAEQHLIVCSYLR